MKTRWKILIGVLAGAAAAYAGFSVYSMNRFPLYATLNGKDVSLMTPDAVKTVFDSESQGYALEVTGRGDLTDTIGAADIDLHPVFGDTIEQMVASRSPWLWFTALWEHPAYKSETVVSFDEDKLADKVGDTVFFDTANVVKPQNAGIAIEDDAFVVQPETEGQDPDKDKTIEAVKEAVYGLQAKLDLDGSGVYKEPSLRADDETLVAEADTLNRFADGNTTIDLGPSENGGEAEEVLSPEDIESLLDVNGTTVTVDDAAVTDYVEDLAEKYNTAGKEHTFYTHDNRKITIEKGNYGWELDEEATTEALLDLLKSEKAGTVEAVWTRTAAQHGTNDYGDSYFEVDLDEQHVYVYQDGECVFDTACVSGKAVVGHGTPDGIYPVTYKQKDAVLRGDNYASPVKYWMPFNGGVGFHDASWRSKFGGTIYITSGSHGCVNLPTASAEKIFSYINKGDPVICYGGYTQAEAEAYAKEHHITIAAPKTDDTAAADAGAQNPTDPAAGAADPGTSDAQKPAPVLTANPDGTFTITDPATGASVVVDAQGNIIGQ